MEEEGLVDVVGGEESAEVGPGLGGFGRGGRWNKNKRNISLAKRRHRTGFEPTPHATSSRIGTVT